MQEVVVALFAIGVGVVFSFYGYKVMRILFPLWGFVAGYWAGAGLTSLITGDSFLGTSLGILIGVVFGLVAAVLAYLYYAVAVIAFMGIVGYWLGAGFVHMLGIETNVLSAIVGIALAVLFILAGIYANVPKYFLLLLTAFIGAALLVAGVMLMANVINLPQLQRGALHAISEGSWVWEVLWAGIGVAAFLTQLSHTEQEELNWASEWDS